jgi:hypothetical protein
MRPHLYPVGASPGTNGSTFIPDHLFTRYKWPKHLFVLGEEKIRYKCEVICTGPNYASVQKPTTSHSLPRRPSLVSLPSSFIFLATSHTFHYLISFFLFFNYSHLSLSLIQAVDRSRGGSPKGRDGDLPSVGAHDLQAAQGGSASAVQGLGRGAT